MKTRVLAMLLVLGMLACLMAGCGSTAASAPAASGAESATASEAEAPAADAEAAAEPAPEATLAPDEVQSSAVEEALAAQELEPMELPIAGTPVTFTYFVSRPGGRAADALPNGYEDARWYQKASELTGVTLEVIQPDMMVASEQFNLTIASGDYPDIFGSFNSMYTDGEDHAIEEEIIIPLEDYEDLFPYYTKYRTSTRFLSKATVTSEGHIGGFYELMSDFIGPFFGMIGRQDWLDNLGLEMPETYDELHDVLTAFKNEYGCNTTLMLDENAVGNDNFLAAGYGIATMLATNAKESYWYLNDGEVKDGITGEGYKEYLSMLHQWYEEGLISKDFTSSGGAMSTDGFNQIASGDCGVFFNGAPIMDVYSSVTDDPNFHVVAFPDPVKEKGEFTHVDTTEYDFGAERMSISTACEDPEIAIQYCDFWFTDEGIQLGNYGVEGESCVVVDGVAQFSDLVLDHLEIDPISVYTGRNSTPFWESNKRLLPTFSEDVVNAFATWASNRDNRDAYPYVAELTMDERYELAKLASDYESYALECRDKFINGDMDIEAEYEAYEEQVRTMGLTRALEIKQAAYDRYMEG